MSNTFSSQENLTRGNTPINKFQSSERINQKYEKEMGNSDQELDKQFNMQFSLSSISSLKTRKNSDSEDVWPDTREEYRLGNVIGVGATSIVEVAHCISKNQDVAVKRVNLDNYNTPMEELLKEIKAMSQCNHQNIVKFYTSFVVMDELWIVMEFCDYGSALDFIKAKSKLPDSKNGVLDDVLIATILKEVIKGLDYIHSNNQIHRDIKAGNILICRDGSIKIADFGVSAWLSKESGDDSLRHTFVGTPCWMAPEVMEQTNGYDYKADIWSFGITALEMATGTAPYYKFPPMKVLMLTLDNEPPTIDINSTCTDQYKAYGKLFRKLIADCLRKDSSKRPTAKQLLKHEFIKKAKDRSYIAKIFQSSKFQLAEEKSNIMRIPGKSGKLHQVGESLWELSDTEMDPDSTIGKEALKNKKERYPTSYTCEYVDSTSEKENFPKSVDYCQLSICFNNDERVLEHIHFLLIIRGGSLDKNEVRFQINVNKDTPEGVAKELYDAGLIYGQDEEIICEELSRILANDLDADEFVFKLNSNEDKSNAKKLYGYAKIQYNKKEPLENV
ncbi:Pseudokinase ALS2CR2 [Intoshia linei]|uniref:non-specific serine/threonine protein kinase n=1 Tax=Intoshia linei TaxID=1819745 RepID=A0A177B1Z6_9BILA|nr:Pseudokinase ALS2CR2 [Intoshia linei]